MDDSYANGDDMSVSFDTTNGEPDETVVIGSPVDEIEKCDAAQINVYSSSFTASEYGPSDSNIVSFDVVFTVTISDNNSTNCKTYQVVKRIGVDKCKLAAEASSGTPISIIEAKKVVDQKPILSEAKRFKRLAGLE